MTEHLKAKPIKKGDICLTLAVPIPEFYTEWGNLQVEVGEQYQGHLTEFDLRISPTFWLVHHESLPPNAVYPEYYLIPISDPDQAISTEQENKEPVTAL